MAMPPQMRMQGGHFTRFSGHQNYPQHRHTRPKKKIRHSQEGEVTYETEIRLWDKVGALRLTAQHLGMLVEKHEHTGTIDIRYQLVAHLEAALGKAYGHDKGEQ